MFLLALRRMDASLRWHDKSHPRWHANALRFFAIALVLAACSPSRATPAIPGFYIDQNVQASHNPLGVQFATRVFYRLPLLAKPTMLFESNKLDVSFQNNLSPSYEFVGIYARFEPIAFFDIAATAQLTGYYNALGYGFVELSGYDSALAPSEEYLTRSRNAFGFTTSISPTFKFAIGPISAANTFTLAYFFADDGKGFFFERIGNVPLAKSDIELINSAYLLVEPLTDLYVGVNDWLLYVPGSAYLSHRLSGIAAYTFHISDTFSAYAAVLLGTFLNDRYFQYAFTFGSQLGVALRI